MTRRYAPEDIFAAALILCGFWMSAHAQYYWAAEIGNLRAVAIGVPVTTDAFGAYCGVVFVRRHTAGVTVWGVTAAMVTAVALAVTINYLHVRHWFAVVPPVMMAVGLKLLVGERTRRARTSSGTPGTSPPARDVTGGANGQRLTLDELRVAIPTRDDLEELLEEHGSLRAAAATVPTHPSTLSRRRDELVSANGQRR